MLSCVGSLAPEIGWQAIAGGCRLMLLPSFAG